MLPAIRCFFLVPGVQAPGFLLYYPSDRWLTRVFFLQKSSDDSDDSNTGGHDMTPTQTRHHEGKIS